MAHVKLFNNPNELWDFLLTFRHRNEIPLCNGFVIQQYFDNEKHLTETAKKIAQLLNLSQPIKSVPSIKIKISRLMKQFMSLKCKFKTNGLKIFGLLNSEFSTSSNSNVQVHDSYSIPNPPANASVGISITPLESDNLQVPVLPVLKENQSPIKTRTDCDKCTDMKASYIKEISSLKSKNNALIKENKRIKFTYSVKKVNQRIKRLNKRIADLSEKCASLKINNTKLSLEINRHKKNKPNLLSALKRKLTVTSCKLNSASKASKKLKNEVDSQNKKIEILEDMLADSDSEEDNECSRIFSDSMRKCVFKCLISNVPTDTTNSLILYITQCLGGTQQVPHSSTIARCAYELGILCDLQIAQFIHQSTNLTLAWDATTLRGTHINQVIITSDDGVMCVSTDVLPGGTSEDYADHLVSCITHIASVHADFSGTGYVGVVNEITSKLKCTMSDRASVNHCAAVRLMNHFEINLLELNCQVHPLECFAVAAREAILAHEREVGGRQSKTFGQMAGAVNVIAALSKLRYKDGKGDPLGFKTFLKAEKIDRSLLIRYVGNRLHALFHLAGSVFHLKAKLLAYLDRCSQKTLRLAIIADLSDALITTHLQVLGLFGKVVTGPWMAVIYSSGSERQHMEKTKQVLDCIDFVKKIASQPELLIVTSVDGFGRPISQDDVLDSLRAAPATSLFTQAAAAVATRVHCKLEKQLQKYRTNPQYDPSSREVQERTSSASVHNMMCERGLGMMDHLCRRAPNALIKSLDSRVRGSINGILQWLEGQENQADLLKFARKRGAVLRKQNAIIMKRIEEKVLQRQQEKGQEREMVARRKKEKDVLKAINENKLEFLDDQNREIVDFVLDLLAEKSGADFQHVWSTKEGKDDVYFGRIQKFKSEKGMRKARISYWQGDNYDDAVDYLISIHSLIADCLLGDVYLC